MGTSGLAADVLATPSPGATQVAVGGWSYRPYREVEHGC